jgi:hypothetical protein
VTLSTAASVLVAIGFEWRSSADLPCHDAHSARVTQFFEPPGHHLREGIDRTTQGDTAILKCGVDYGKTDHAQYFSAFWHSAKDRYLGEKSREIAEAVYGIAQREPNIAKIRVIARGTHDVADQYGHPLVKIREFDLEEYNASEVRKYTSAWYLDDRDGVNLMLHMGGYENFPELQRY